MATEFFITEVAVFRHRLPVFIAIASALLAACGGGPDSLPMEATEIDPFSAGSISVIRGAAGARYGPDAIGGVILVEPIESLGLTTVTVHEPFLNMELEITGVPIDDLLAAAGVDPDATLTWTALDDYEVHFSRREVAAEEAILATRIDNAPIELADGGPIRIIFTDPDGMLGRDTNQWIWNLYEIEVE